MPQTANSIRRDTSNKLVQIERLNPNKKSNFLRTQFEKIVPEMENLFRKFERIKHRGKRFINLLKFVEKRRHFFFYL